MYGLWKINTLPNENICKKLHFQIKAIGIFPSHIFQKR